MDSIERPARTGVGVLIGCGLIAEGHLDGYERIDGLEIGVVVEPSKARRPRAAALVPGADVVASLDGVDLQAYDFVDICSPPSTHLQYALLSLDAGLPTLCEKPLVLDLGELKTLDDAGASSAGFVYPCHNYSFAPSMRRLLQLLPSLRTSRDQPTRGHFRTLRVGHARGVAEWRPDWRRDPEVGGGGILQDHGPHSIYIAMRAIGTRLVAVRCHTLCPAYGPFSLTEDMVKLDLHFECGSMVTIELDWGNSTRQSSYLFDGSWGYLRLIDDRLIGQCGATVIRAEIESNFNDPRHGAWFEAVLRDFLASWDDPTLAAALRDEAYEVVRVIAAGYRSSQAGGLLLERDCWPDEASAAHEVSR